MWVGFRASAVDVLVGAVYLEFEGINEHAYSGLYTHLLAPLSTFPFLPFIHEYRKYSTSITLYSSGLQTIRCRFSSSDIKSQRLLPAVYRFYHGQKPEGSRYSLATAAAITLGLYKIGSPYTKNTDKYLYRLLETESCMTKVLRLGQKRTC